MARKSLPALADISGKAVLSELTVKDRGRL